MRPSAQREETPGSPRLRTRQVIKSDVATPTRPCRGDVGDYGLGVDCYEQLCSLVILPAAVALIPWPGLAGRSTDLDAGAGTGALISAIRSAAPTARVVALDASPQMLRVARIQRRARAVQADAMALPMAAEAVHAVILAYVLFHLADPLAALKEAARLLRPRGRVGPVTWASQRAERAQVVWDHALVEAGVPLCRPAVPMPVSITRRRLTPFCARPPGSPAHLGGRLQRQWDPASFWALATGSGASRQRLGLIDPDTRSVLLAGLRAQLNELAPADYLWEARSFARWGACPAPAGASLRWQPARSPASTKWKRPTACRTCCRTVQPGR